MIAKRKTTSQAKFSQALIWGDSRTGQALAIYDAAPLLQGGRLAFAHAGALRIDHESSSPLVLGAAALRGIPASPGEAECLDLAAGAVRWRAKLTRPGETLVSCIEEGNRAFGAAVEKGKKPTLSVFAFSLETGEIVWTRNTPFSGDAPGNEPRLALAPGGSGLVVLGGSRLTLLDRNKGTLIRESTLTDSPAMHVFPSGRLRIGDYLLQDDGTLPITPRRLSAPAYRVEFMEVGPREEAKNLALHVLSSRACYPELDGWLSAWRDNAEAGAFILLKMSPATPMGATIAAVWFDAATDSVLVYERQTDTTYVFDRKALIEFLTLPGT